MADDIGIVITKIKIGLAANIKDAQKLARRAEKKVDSLTAQLEAAKRRVETWEKLIAMHIEDLKRVTTEGFTQVVEFPEESAPTLQQVLELVYADIERLAEINKRKRVILRTVESMPDTIPLLKAENEELDRRANKMIGKDHNFLSFLIDGKRVVFLFKTDEDALLCRMTF